jgi:pimeloyl-ACP methyl ester carboxylesterase
MPKLDVNGGILTYETAGSPSSPAVVFIHAGIATRTMWWPQLTEFANRYFVVIYDTRGFGDTVTTDPDVQYSNRDDLLRLLDHLQVERAAIVGCSRGGQIALDFALEHPSRVWALVSSCGGIGGFDPGVSPEEQGIIDQMIAAEQAQDYDRLIELNVALWVHGFGRPAIELESPLLQAIGDNVRQWERLNATHAQEGGTPIVLDPPALNRLGEIRVPMLYIVGTYDSQHTHRAGDYIARHVSGAQRTEIAGAHLPNLEQPDLWNEVVLEFLEPHRPDA